MSSPLHPPLAIALAVCCAAGTAQAAGPRIEQQHAQHAAPKAKPALKRKGAPRLRAPIYREAGQDPIA